jgi:hypothetical protein
MSLRSMHSMCALWGGNPRNARTHTGRLDWPSVRDRVDLTAVATALLGEPAGRRGERGRRLWWSCPFHPDRNPSFCDE